MQAPAIVSRETWIAARRQLLAQEKALTRQRDALHAARQRLPWVKVEKRYVFDTPDGPRSLADLFDGRSQLIVKHFMLGPGWKEGCVGCSFSADMVDGALVHLAHHDVSYVTVSRAPLPEIQAFQRRMGWQFRWVSSFGGDFNFDYHVSFTEAERASGTIYYNYEMRPIDMDELSGVSVFYRDEDGQVFHTYSTYARGTDLLTGVYNFLDITPKGRNEPLRGNLSEWVRHHDRYESGGSVAPTGRYVPADDCCHEG